MHKDNHYSEDMPLNRKIFPSFPSNKSPKKMNGCILFVILHWPMRRCSHTVAFTNQNTPYDENENKEYIEAVAAQPS